MDTRFCSVRGAMLGLLVLTSLGCTNRSHERVVVTGEVTYRGKPVKDGEVRLFPKPGTQAPMSGALIRDGHYTADRLGGVPVGTFRVEVTAYRASRTDEGGDIEKQNAGGQFLPARFNSESQLELTVPKDSGPIVHNLHLAE
jgi:hypothetical protein